MRFDRPHPRRIQLATLLVFCVSPFWPGCSAEGTIPSEFDGGASSQRDAGGVPPGDLLDGGAMPPADVAPPPPPAPPEPPNPGPTFVPATARLRRLLGYQYRNAVEDLLGSAAAEAADPPPDVPLNGFTSVGSATLAVSPLDVERYEQSAFAIAASAVYYAPASSLRVCAPVAYDDLACAQQIVATFGRRAFRRRLTPEEVSRWSNIFMEAAEAYGDFDFGLEYAVAGILQSPHFLYMIEVGEPDPSVANARRLTGSELATRLSFFLLGTTPPASLLEAAEEGLLDTAEGIRVHASLLLANPRARDALNAYFREVLGLGRLPQLNRPDTSFSPAIASAMQEETLRFIDDIVWERNADARELLDGSFTYVNDPLAGFYGLPAPGTGDELVRVMLDPGQERRGLLTQGAFLARLAHEDRSSPTLRGKYIRENLLCQAVPPPPNDVNTVLPETTEEEGPRTTRERLDAHVADPNCAGCHSFMDPLGFPLERFDQAGRFRYTENGLAIRTESDVDGVPVENALGLASELASTPAVPACLIKNLFRHGTGHLEDIGEFASIQAIQDAFESSGYRLQDGLLSIIESDAFRYVSEPDGVQ